MLLAAGSASLPGTIKVQQGKGVGPNGEWQVQLLDGGSLSIVGAVSVNILDAGAPLNINPPVSLPLPTGAATDSNLSRLLDGGIASLGMNPSGALQPMALTAGGAVWSTEVAPRPPLNPFLPRCNAVRKIRCQP